MAPKSNVPLSPLPLSYKRAFWQPRANSASRIQGFRDTDGWDGLEVFKSELEPALLPVCFVWASELQSEIQARRSQECEECAMSGTMAFHTRHLMMQFEKRGWAWLWRQGVGWGQRDGPLRAVSSLLCTDGDTGAAAAGAPRDGRRPLPAGQHQLSFWVMQCLRWIIPAVPVPQSTGDTKISLVQVSGEIKTRLVLHQFISAEALLPLQPLEQKEASAFVSLHFRAPFRRRDRGQLNVKSTLKLPAQHHLSLRIRRNHQVSETVRPK